MRLTKAVDGAKHMVIDFSDDNNGEHDSQGEFTMALLTKADMPRDFTICAAFMVEAWTTDFNSARLFQLSDVDGDYWAYVEMFAADMYTEFRVRLGEVHFLTTVDHVLFPLTWTRVCLSLDTGSGKTGFVVDGRVLDEMVHPEAMNEDKTRPRNLSLVLGYDPTNYLEETGTISQLNIFSSPLSSAKMAALTQAGGAECGSPGDYVSWEEEDWQLQSQARRKTVGELEGPCWRESQVMVYSADFRLHKDCMEHCQKLGQGRSPPVRTLEEWNWLWGEVNAITPQLWTLNYLWLAATDEEKEEVWRDYYSPHDHLETGVVWPWYNIRGDTDKGDTHNCLLMYTDESADDTWDEAQCSSYDQACPCQNAEQPLLFLRGLCFYNTLDMIYTPKQLATNPNNMIILGYQTSNIQYSDSISQWILTDASSNVTAVSMASKVSYVLGKHKWTVTGDVYECHEGQPYTTYLKLSGCNPIGEFTCDDGQCVAMEKRCDQVPNCRDQSDERGCQLMVTKEGYNKNIPPITVKSSDQSTVPVCLNISIELLQIIDMEEQDHKIDLQFQITLEWRENSRVVFQNLKKKKSLNVLSDEEISQIWLPMVFYDNTDQKEATRLGAMWEWNTAVSVQREGSHDSCETNPSCGRSGLEELDEIEMFEGGGNTIEMLQVYTRQFQCKYDLQYYPFDTQVTCGLLFVYPLMNISTKTFSKHLLFLHCNRT